MPVTLQLASLNQRYILQNIWPAYMHDLSQYQTHKPNDHGLLDEAGIKSYSDENFMTAWTDYPEDVFVFFIRVEESLAGIGLVVSSALAKCDADKLLHDFFVFRYYRGKGIAQSAATQIFDWFKGSWQLEVLSKNLPALSFWRKVIDAYSDEYKEDAQDSDGEQLIGFTFSSPSTGTL